MNRIFWINVYRLIIFPVIFVAAHIIGIFSKKVRDVLREKYSVCRQLQQWLATGANKEAKNVLFHAASLGEFEHIRPVLFQLKKRYHTNNIVTFFSPSGYKHVKTGNGVDYFSYTPFDTSSQWKKIYDAVKPLMLIVAKHDVWPAQIWTARDNQIPAYLINASLSAASTRSRFPFGRILSIVYRDFREIMTISEEDCQRFRKSYTGLNLSVAGDTKYDQVLLRMEKAQHHPPLDKGWRNNNSKVLIAGSIWPEDEAHLVPAFQKLLADHTSLKVILVPHEPVHSTVQRLHKRFLPFNPERFSKVKDRKPGSRVLIVDQVGHLAGLYYLADMAYVGGSFKQGIHSTMEPAVYGIPVLFGPVYTNSYEAVKLLEAGGARLIRNQEELYSTVHGLILNTEEAAGIGKTAERFARENTGATDKLISAWSDILEESVV